jgi:uncharacterized coiled-coil protein SlyX
VTELMSPDLLALYRGEADEDDSGFYSIHAVRDLFDHIDAQEDRIAALEEREAILIGECRALNTAIAVLQALSDDTEAHITALAGAARAVVAGTRKPNHYEPAITYCLFCSGMGSHHHADCLIGALAALLEGS